MINNNGMHKWKSHNIMLHCENAALSCIYPIKISTSFYNLRISYNNSCENPYQYTASHVRIRTRPARYYKTVTCAVSERAMDKIIITIVPSYTGTCLLPLALLLVQCTRNNTDDSNKRVIFSGIALYYGDIYILCNFMTGN